MRVLRPSTDAYSASVAADAGTNPDAFTADKRPVGA